MAVTRTRATAAATPRRGWLADAVIAGFVATGASTIAFIVAFLAAASLGSREGGGTLGSALYELTHNPVVSLGQGQPAVALALHVVFGLVWALVYARLFATRLPGPGWAAGMLFSLGPWLLSLLVFLPVTGAGIFGANLNAGVLPAIGNFALHLIYGAILGQLYAPEANRPAVAEDVGYDEPVEDEAVAHSEALGAAGILSGLVVGALVGGALALLVPRDPADAFGGWSLALAVGGLLAGGAVGAIVGSFAGLPSTPDDAHEASLPSDPFERNVLPWVIIPTLLLVIAGIIVSFGSVLLSLAPEPKSFPPVIAALIGTVVIGLGAVILARRQEPPSDRTTVTQSGH